MFKVLAALEPLCDDEDEDLPMGTSLVGAGLYRKCIEKARAEKVNGIHNRRPGTWNRTVGTRRDFSAGSGPVSVGWKRKKPHGQSQTTTTMDGTLEQARSGHQWARETKRVKHTKKHYL